jgi:hypothetical protein
MMILQIIAVNDIQYVTQSSAMILIGAALLTGFIFGIYYERITGGR